MQLLGNQAAPKNCSNRLDMYRCIVNCPVQPCRCQVLALRRRQESTYFFSPLNTSRCGEWSDMHVAVRGPEAADLFSSSQCGSRIG